MNPEPNGEAKIRFWKAVAITTFTLMIAGPLAGMGITVVGMISAFNQFSNDTESPAELSQDVSLALNTTAIGIGIGVCLLPLFIVSLVRYRRLKTAALQTPAT